MKSISKSLLSGFAIGLIGLAGCNFPVPGSATPTPLSTVTAIPPTGIVTRTLAPSPTPIEAMPSQTPSPTPRPRLIGYFYGADKNNILADVPADKFGVLIDAFITVSPEGNCVSIDPAADAANFPRLQQLKLDHPGLKTVVSVGGYADSAHFSDAAASNTSRLQLTRSCLAFMLQNGFDGIDIDWEFPVSGGLPGNSHRPEDRHNLTLLLADLRKALDEQGNTDGRNYSLSIAAPAGPGEYAHFELFLIHPYLDWITVMAYSFYTANSPVTNFASALFPSPGDPATDPTRRLTYNGDAAIQAYLAAGVPPGKLSLGVPFYGHAWMGVPPANHGLFQADAGPFVDDQVPKGTWDSLGEITYRALAQYYLAQWPRFWSPDAKEPWLYNPDRQVFVTYEDAESLGVKADYVKSNHLGGISIWQVSQDDAQHSLVNALADRWAGP